MTEGNQSRILVVDDVRESALITRALLARGNFDRIDIASGGLEALKMCRRTPVPDRRPRHHDARY